MSRKVTVAFLRHAQAAAPEGTPDSGRMLTDKGRSQAFARRERMGNPKFDLVCVSPLVRTHQTAAIVAGNNNLFTDAGRVCVLPELFTPSRERDLEMHDALERMYEELKHAPLRAYTNHELGSFIIRFGQSLADAILGIIETFDDVEMVLVVGHGCYNTAAVDDMWLSSGVDIAKSDERMSRGPLLHSFAAGECEGIEVTLIEEEDRLVIDDLRLIR